MHASIVILVQDLDQFFMKLQQIAERVRNNRRGVRRSPCRQAIRPFAPTMSLEAIKRIFIQKWYYALILYMVGVNGR